MQVNNEMSYTDRPSSGGYESKLKGKYYFTMHKHATDRRWLQIQFIIKSPGRTNKLQQCLLFPNELFITRIMDVAHKF